MGVHKLYGCAALSSYKISQLTYGLCICHFRSWHLTTNAHVHKSDGFQTWRWLHPALRRGQVNLYLPRIAELHWSFLGLCI